MMEEHFRQKGTNNKQKGTELNELFLLEQPRNSKQACELGMGQGRVVNEIRGKKNTV